MIKTINKQGQICKTSWIVIISTNSKKATAIGDPEFNRTLLYPLSNKEKLANNRLVNMEEGIKRIPWSKRSSDCLQVHQRKSMLASIFLSW